MPSTSNEKKVNTVELASYTLYLFIVLPLSLWFYKTVPDSSLLCTLLKNILEYLTLVNLSSYSRLKLAFHFMLDKKPQHKC